jgi:hypothetical protein
MKAKGAEERAAVYRIALAASGQFTPGMVNGRDRLARPHSSWDPYEVWRTRIKGVSSVMQELDFNKRAGDG